MSNTRLSNGCRHRNSISNIAMSLDCNGSNDSFDSKENRGTSISQTSSISGEFREPTSLRGGTKLSIEDDASSSNC
jgi:hypothetical protein